MKAKEKIPELRFPEFEGVLEEKSMGNLFANSRLKGNSSKPIFSISQKHGLIPRESMERNIQNDANANDNLLVKPGYITYNTMRMWQGAIGMATIECMVSPAYVVLKPSKDTWSNYFLSVFARQRSLYLFMAYSHGLTLDRLRLYYRDFAKIKLIVPTLPEQQKIAAFLTALDRRIQLLRDKKQHLETWKKGLMQKIFNREIRFKDDQGKDFPEWEEKRLGEICEKRSSNISANVLGESNGTYKIYGASGFLQFVDFYREKDLYISIVKDGAGVGRTMLCDAYSSVLGTLDIIKPKSNNNLFFLYYLLSNIRFGKFITGSTIPHIYFRDYSKGKIMRPHAKEQQKIASFLSAIDQAIDQVNHQIESTQSYKKGLLQKMFV